MPELVNLTSELIKELISCKKQIIGEPSPKDKSNGQHKQTDFLLESTDKKHKFLVFVREHLSLLEFFSIGLVYMPDDASSIILLRYNGNHGEHYNKLTNQKISGFHIHTISVEAISHGLKDENQAVVTKKYSSASQAFVSFCKNINIQNFTQYFPEKLQGELFI
ncbi:MAG: hypothetical protein ABIJ43_04700 [Candidatus Beckwithbacteria bacterium]|nr:hypothetical protein [Patescibacteria group bacterium]